MRWFLDAWDWVVGRFSRSPLVVVDVPKPKRLKRENVGSEIEETGRFYYLGNILDRMEESFRVLREMKKYDPDGHKVFMSLGGCMVPQATFVTANDDNRDRFFKDGYGYLSTDPVELPALMSAVYVHEKDTKESFDGSDVCGLKFIYFKKIKSAAYVQRHNGTIFEGTAYYNEKYKEKGKPHLKFSLPFYVAVLPDRSVVPLKVCMAVPQTVGKKRKVTITHKKFSNPVFIDMMMDEQKRQGRETTAESLLSMLFLSVCTTSNAVESGFTVTAKKGSEKVKFAIDQLRAPYFFKDRDASVEGKKIFHIVRGHERITGKGVSMVRSHFRGLRQFVWNGYGITISVPSLHYVPVTEFNLPGYDAEDKIFKHETGIDLEDLAGVLGGQYTAVEPNRMATFADEDRAHSRLKSSLNDLPEFKH